MMVRYCKRCVMPDTRPGIRFNDDGICWPCLNHERKNLTIRKNKKLWENRLKIFKWDMDQRRSKDGSIDCVIPVSGGKDSYFQTYMMKHVAKMHPILISVSDPFTHTKVGIHNLRNMSEVFECDLYTFNLNPSTTRKMVRLAFEHYGAPTWPIDLGIYSIPLKFADAMHIPLVIYGENISYEYGGPGDSPGVEAGTAHDQIHNNVVLPIPDEWWYEHGIIPTELANIRYPPDDVVARTCPKYMSTYYPWSGYGNYKIAESFGFRTSDGEWDREGFIENYDQIDSLGYVIHPWLKWPKFGHARVTDVASIWIREGRITRDEAVKLVHEKEGKIDPAALADFLRFTGYTEEEFWEIVDRFYNPELFEKRDGEWVLKNPVS